MRIEPIIKNTYYHVYNRGVLKQIIFLQKTDYIRFLFLLIYNQSPTQLDQTNRYVTKFLKTNSFSVPLEKQQEIVSTSYVKILNFCIMPNHFHIALQTTQDGGLSKYMHRVCNAYGKYFNLKYEKSGHVFQGQYRARIIDDENDLTYLSAYIHLNPREIPGWKNKETDYPWSSFQDYTNNRWGDLLHTTDILDRFSSKHLSYTDYVKASGAKNNFNFE